MKETLNHEAFMEQVQQIADKDEQIRLMKAYWFNLPMEEFFTFIRSNVNDIGIGLQELLALKVLSSDEKNNLNNDFEEGIALLKTMKKNTLLPKTAQA
jgi:hypothetical protein